MANGSLKQINENQPSTLAKIVMEVEPLNEKEKQVMLRQVRMRKALLMAEKLKGSVKPNKITLGFFQKLNIFIDLKNETQYQ
jgi:hypothetical protein